MLIKIFLLKSIIKLKIYLYYIFNLELYDLKSKIYLYDIFNLEFYDLKSN